MLLCICCSDEQELHDVFTEEKMSNFNQYALNNISLLFFTIELNYIIIYNYNTTIYNCYMLYSIRRNLKFEEKKHGFARWARSSSVYIKTLKAACNSQRCKVLNVLHQDVAAHHLTSALKRKERKIYLL